MYAQHIISFLEQLCELGKTLSRRVDWDCGRLLNVPRPCRPSLAEPGIEPWGQFCQIAGEALPGLLDRLLYSAIQCCGAGAVSSPKPGREGQVPELIGSDSKFPFIGGVSFFYTGGISDPFNSGLLFFK